MKKFRERLFIVVLVLMMAFSFTSTALAETAQATRYCAVYLSPDETSPCLGWLSVGDHVTVNFAQGRWSDVTFANGTGYVLSSNLGAAVSRAIPVITSNPVPVITTNPVPVIPQSTPVPVVQQPVPVIQQPVPVIQQPVPVVQQQPVPVIGSTTNLFTTSKLNVRCGPSTKYAKLGVLQAGAPVCVIDALNNGWYKINFNGVQGYVYSKYVQKGSVVVSGYVAPMNMTMITNSIATAYRGTGVQYGEVCAFPAGYRVQVVGVCGNWYKVSIGGQYGYIQRAYLSDPNSPYYIW